ncbi:methyltransferase family protein [Capsulimonas corticalis]|nr:isoprenylcysteine carboxylmethyltransferase family protein [Capsulimonas corticalis]
MTSSENPTNPPAVGRPPFLVRRRTMFTWLIPLLLMAAVVLLKRGDGGVPAYAAGIVLVFLGEVVRFWAAGYISKDAVIATGGPYAYVRNPLYFGSLLLAIGYGLVSGLGWGGVIAMTALFFLFHLAAIRYEESFLKVKFGQPYLDYLARVPRIIPSLSPRTRGDGAYTWAQAINNREHLSALFAVVFVIALTVCRVLVLKHG